MLASSTLSPGEIAMVHVCVIIKNFFFFYSPMGLMDGSSFGFQS